MMAGKLGPTTEFVITTGATQVENQPIPGSQLFHNSVYLRDVSQPHIASTYKFVGENVFRDPRYQSNATRVSGTVRFRATVT